MKMSSGLQGPLIKLITLMYRDLIGGWGQDKGMEKE